MRIGILGGSFDPIHKGHLALARESQKQFWLDKILFIPALQPPHKTQKKELITPAAHRAHMIRLAIEGEPSWELCDIEFQRQGLSFTVDTLTELRKIFPSPHELFFIAGADSFQEIGTWKNPEEILQLSEWIVAPRPSYELPLKMPPHFHQLEIKPMPISATELREKMSAGKNVSEWVPQAVCEYINQTKMYRGTRR